MAYVPARGDLVWLTFDPRVGHEQSGRRPALVLSPSSYNQRLGMALVCPITSRGKDYPFEVAIPDGLPVHGFVLVDQIKCVDWKARQIEFLSKLAPSVLAEVINRLQALLEDV